MCRCKDGYGFGKTGDAQSPLYDRFGEDLLSETLNRKVGGLERVPLYDRFGVDLLSKTPNRKVEYVLLKRIEFNSFITV